MRNLSYLMLAFKVALETKVIVLRTTFFLHFIMLHDRLQARRKRGGRGGPCPPHFLADQLTLSQPGGGTLPPPSTMCPPRFSDLATALHCIHFFQHK